MSTTVIADHPRAAIQRTFADFHTESSEWESEVAQFLDDFDRFIGSAAPSRFESSGSPSQIEADVASLRSLVEQQTDVLTALVNALAGEAPSTPSPAQPDTDQVVEAFFDRVEQLQNASADADDPS